MTNLHLVHGNECLYISIDYDARAFADHKDVVKKNWEWAFTLDVDSDSMATYQCIISEHEYVGFTKVVYYTTTLKLVELTLLN